jgi:hypothetical protein
MVGNQKQRHTITHSVEAIASEVQIKNDHQVAMAIVDEGLVADNHG